MDSAVNMASISTCNRSVSDRKKSLGESLLRDHRAAVGATTGLVTNSISFCLLFTDTNWFAWRAKTGYLSFLPNTKLHWSQTHEGLCELKQHTSMALNLALCALLPDLQRNKDPVRSVALWPWRSQNTTQKNWHKSRWCVWETLKVSRWKQQTKCEIVRRPGRASCVSLRDMRISQKAR